MEARLDGNSELVAELVTANGFKAAYAIKDGAEGPRGWTVFLVATLFLFCFMFIIFTFKILTFLCSSIH